MKIAIFTDDKNKFIHILQRIESRCKLAVSDLVLLSVSDLEGKEVSYGNSFVEIKNINKYDNFIDINIAVFMVNKELTLNYVDSFVKNKCTVLDCSDCFMKDKTIPTIIYDLNKSKIKEYKHKNIIKMPTASTIQLLQTINPLRDLSEIRRVVVSTYQSTSVISRNAMNELYDNTKKVYENGTPIIKNFKKQIAFNVLAQVGDAMENKYSNEEERIIVESREVLNNKINITATCVVVPTFVGSCQSINIEFEDNFNINEVYEVYRENNDHINLVDRFEEYEYATPKDIATEEDIFISRIRKDESIENGLNLWSVADNLQIEMVNIVETIVLCYGLQA
jgi:aspartate-semialdehyde dehydrogenase